MPEVSHDVAEDPALVNTIILWRIYDVLSVLLSNINPKDWESVMKAHEAGIFITPAPAFRVGEEE